MRGLFVEDDYSQFLWIGYITALKPSWDGGVEEETKIQVKRLKKPLVDVEKDLQIVR